MSEQLLLALGFTQIDQIPTGDGGDCGWLRRKLSQCHHKVFCLAAKRRKIHKRVRILTPIHDQFSQAKPPSPPCPENANISRMPPIFPTQRGSLKHPKKNEKAIKRIISIAFCFVKGVALAPIFQNITQDVMPICSWYLTTTFLETSFSCQNRLSKPRIQAIFTTFYCNIKQLPWSDPRPEHPRQKGTLENWNRP